MKTEPTDIDREAARLFNPAPGMRVILADRLFGGLWARVATASPSLISGCYEAGCDTWDASIPFVQLSAVDTDDPATVGAMLAQLRAAVPGFGCDMAHVRPMPTSAEMNRMAVIIRRMVPTYCGATEGAALVGAMRALGRKVAA